MSENIRALIVILGISIPFFLLAKKTACSFSMTEDDFIRRRNLWLGVTCVAFLSHNFWLFLFFSIIFITFAGMRESSRFPMYLFVIFALPLFPGEIPGFGVVNYLIAMDYPKLLSLILLLPCYLQLRRDPDIKPFGSTFADKCVLGYIVLPLILQGLDDTLTNTFRQGVVSFLDLFLPYYVASRSLRNIEIFRDAMMSFVIGILLMAPIALFEYLWKWLLYINLPSSMGLKSAMGYLSRGSSLRAMASAGHALALAYLMVVGCGLYVYVRRLMPSPKMVMLGLVVLLAGLWSPVSRGPWLAAVLVLAVIYATGERPISRSLKLALICTPFIAGVLLSPMGEGILAVLPIVGTVDKENEIYRQRLFETSLQVIEMYPFFGSFTFRELPIMQSLIQGEKIIDIVNSYLGVALTYGLVGLAFYLGMFLSALAAVWRGFRASTSGDELHVLGRSLLATLLGVMVTIIGVSSISTIGTINMVIIGFCLAYGDLVSRYQAERQRSAMGGGMRVAGRYGPSAG